MDKDRNSPSGVTTPFRGKTGTEVIHGVARAGRKSSDNLIRPISGHEVGQKDRHTNLLFSDGGRLFKTDNPKHSSDSISQCQIPLYFSFAHYLITYSLSVYSFLTCSI